MAGKKTPAKVETVPDVLGANVIEDTENEFIFNVFANTQRERVRLDMMQKVNGHDDDDIVPGEGMPYKVKRQALAASEQRAMEAYPEVVERLRARLAELK